MLPPLRDRQPHRFNRALQRRLRHFGGMGISSGLAAHRAQAEPLGGVVGGGLEPAIVKYQRLGPAAFQKQLAIISSGNGVLQDTQRDGLVETVFKRAERGGLVGHLGGSLLICVLYRLHSGGATVQMMCLFSSASCLQSEPQIEWMMHPALCFRNHIHNHFDSDFQAVALNGIIVLRCNRDKRGILRRLGRICPGTGDTPLLNGIRGMKVTKNLMTMMSATCGLLLCGAALAQEALPVIGKPVAGGLNFQPAVTEIMRDTVWLDTYVLFIITAISVFVTILLLICAFRFNARVNPTPATFTHNALLEIGWTLVPILILIVIMPFSLAVLFKTQIIPEADVTIKATGNQWYWTHEYVDHDFGFDSFMLARDELAENGYAQDEYLLATDTAVVIPTGKTIVVQVTGSDVIHAWTIPAFGVKQDAVPGRLAELWFNVDVGNEGIYFGQCSELCGKDHSFMPITVKAVSQADYETWLDGAIEEYAGTPRDVTVAAK